MVHSARFLLGAALAAVGLGGGWACQSDDGDAGGPGGTGGTATGSTTSHTPSTTTQGTGGAGNADGGGGGAVGGAGGAGGGSDCTAVTITDMYDEEPWLQEDPPGSDLLYLMVGLDENQVHVLNIEFYAVGGAQTTGDFDLSQAPDNSYSTCAHCLFAWENAEGTPTTSYFQSGGTLHVTTADTAYDGTSAGTFLDVQLVEVELVGEEWTPVDGGKCLLLTGGWDHTGG